MSALVHAVGVWGLIEFSNRETHVSVKCITNHYCFEWLCDCHSKETAFLSLVLFRVLRPRSSQIVHLSYQERSTIEHSFGVIGVIKYIWSRHRNLLFRCHVEQTYRIPAWVWGRLLREIGLKRDNARRLRGAPSYGTSKSSCPLSLWTTVNPA